MTTSTRKVCHLFSVLLLVSATCLGQAGRAELFGTILDPSGLPVPKAKIEAEDQATMARVFRHLGRAWRISHPGIAGRPIYSDGASYPVSECTVSQASPCELGDRTGINVSLEVGQPSQSVNVTAAAPLLQTASGEMSLNVDEKTISTLPLDGRNFMPLVTLTPGVALPNGSSPAAHQWQPAAHQRVHL